MSGAGDAPADPTAEILFPDVTFEVRHPSSGEPVRITVRELRFAESMRAASAARPLIEALSRLVGPDTDDPLDAGDVQATLEDHGDAWLAVIAVATGRPVEWLAALSESDGSVLSEAMWRVNGAFLARRVVRTAARRMKSESPSQPSSQRSPEPDTGDTRTSPPA